MLERLTATVATTVFPFEVFLIVNDFPQYFDCFPISPYFQFEAKKRIRRELRERQKREKRAHESIIQSYDIS